LVPASPNSARARPMIGRVIGTNSCSGARARWRRRMSLLRSSAQRRVPWDDGDNDRPNQSARNNPDRKPPANHAACARLLFRALERWPARRAGLLASGRSLRHNRFGRLGATTYTLLGPRPQKIARIPNASWLGPCIRRS
jgi:hypothetical protein